jgi:hypothetical protein
MSALTPEADMRALLQKDQQQQKGNWQHDTNE